MKITEQIEQPLLCRKEIIADIDFKAATPSKADIKKQLATALKVKEDVIVIKNIIQEFGVRRGKVIAHLYDSEKDLKNIESKKKGKEGPKEDAPKKDKPADTPKEAAPVKDTKPESVKDIPKEDTPKDKTETKDDK